MVLEVTRSQEGSKTIIDGYGRDRSNLIPLLQHVQTRLGYLPPETMAAVAEHLGLSEGTVYSVASFYNQFKFKPTGRNIIKVCRGTACHVDGGERILAELERQLGIAPGETTPDMKFTLETVNCLGACALAPVVVVDGKFIGQVSTHNVKSILNGCK
jgi:NADH-quinone oxidoreductase E subunit